MPTTLLKVVSTLRSVLAWRANRSQRPGLGIRRGCICVSSAMKVPLLRFSRIERERRKRSPRRLPDRILNSVEAFALTDWGNAAAAFYRRSGDTRCRDEARDAFENRPRASGDAIRYMTLNPPADSPAIVTFAWSPPNAAIFRWIQRSAST